MVIYLEQDADLHIAQLMPLPLTVSCFNKIQSGFTFLVPADPGSPGKGPLNGCVCVYHLTSKRKEQLQPSEFALLCSKKVKGSPYSITKRRVVYGSRADPGSWESACR